MGCDNNFLKTDYSEVKISIHAPTWGATSTKSMMISTANYFNPRTHMGCDNHESDIILTTREISIHAPTWGATKEYKRIVPLLKISIHAPTWGATGRPCMDWIHSE